MVEVTFLGTSGTLPTKDRNQASIHLRHDDSFIMWDCGEGTQRQMMYTKTSPFKIGQIYISHLHLDHLLGLGGLIQTMQFMGREEDLKIYGPKGIEKYVEFFIDWNYKERGYKIEVEYIKKSILKEGKNYSISAFPVEHGCEAYGFIFQENPGLNLDKSRLEELGLLNSPKCRKLKEEGEVMHGGKKITLEDVSLPKRKGKKIVYSGDTLPCKSLEEAAENADLLIVDSSFGEEHKDKARKYLHGEAKKMAKIAEKAKVKKLVLTHFSNRYNDGSVLEEEAKKVFENTAAAKDFMEIEV